MPTIEALRKNIEAIDHAIIEKLAQRQMLCVRIGQIKKDTKQPVIDLNRELILHTLHAQWALDHQLPQPLISELFRLIIVHCRSLQSTASS